VGFLLDVVGDNDNDDDDDDEDADDGDSKLGELAIVLIGAVWRLELLGDRKAAILVTGRQCCSSGSSDGDIEADVDIEGVVLRAMCDSDTCRRSGTPLLLLLLLLLLEPDVIEPESVVVVSLATRYTDSSMTSVEL